MKRIIFSLTLLLFVGQSFSQSTSTPVSKDYYLKKSKNQKTIAWILLGSGLGIAATGGIVQLTHEKNTRYCNCFDFDFTGAWIAIGGGVVSLSSIPFFISSAKNKNKAAAISFSNQKILLPQQNAFALKMQPTVSIKLGF